MAYTDNFTVINQVVGRLDIFEPKLALPDFNADFVFSPSFPFFRLSRPDCFVCQPPLLFVFFFSFWRPCDFRLSAGFL